MIKIKRYVTYKNMNELKTNLNISKTFIQTIQFIIAYILLHII